MRATGRALLLVFRAYFGVLVLALVFAPTIGGYLIFPLLLFLLAAFFVFNYFHIAVQHVIDDTYRIPGTQIVLRTTFDPWIIAAAPYLEVRVGDSTPLRFCLAGPKLTRADLYSVDGGGMLLETARDTYLIKVEPFAVWGPASWQRYVLPRGRVCDYDARSDAPVSERHSLKANLKLVYLGAFVTGQNGYRRFLPASASPEQKIAP